MRKTENKNSMPDSPDEVRTILSDFIKRYKVIKHEQESLKEDEKNLIEEFTDKLDMKLVKLAMRVVSVKEKVNNKDTFEMLVSELEKL